MVGLEEGGVGVLGLMDVYSDPVSDCVWGWKGRSRLGNCMFSFVPLVMALTGLGDLEFGSDGCLSDRFYELCSEWEGEGPDWRAACFLLYRSSRVWFGVGRGALDSTNACFLLYG